MDVAHLDNQPVQRGDVALEVGMAAGAGQPPVDSAVLRDDSSKPRDVRGVRGDSGCPCRPLEHAHLPRESVPSAVARPIQDRLMRGRGSG